MACKVGIVILTVMATGLPRGANAIDIVLDYSLDAANENWFDSQSSEGLARRNALGSAADFLSTIIVTDDWSGLSSLNESFTLTDIAASSIFDIDGNVLTGSPESDGAGYAYTSSSNDIHTTNRSSVAANEYIVYVGAFAFDAGSTANAKGGSDSADYRNAGGFAGTEFNTWGGKLYFNTAKTWYAGSNPGLDPTDDYGIQDIDKSPAVDITTDNWEWSPSDGSWKGFDLGTVDPSAGGARDLYATALHELMHALGATSSKIEDYVGVDSNGDFTGPNVTQVYGGPVPGNGGHFAEDIQSLVWDSDDIVSEGVLDPNSRSGVRKYLTQLDAALLRDLGYDVLLEFPPTILQGDFNDDGSIDAADYAVWRDNLGQAITLPGDLTPGTVTIEDYNDWRTNFDAASSLVLSNSTAAIPEPTALVLMILGAALAQYPRRQTS